MYQQQLNNETPFYDIAYKSKYAEKYCCFSFKYYRYLYTQLNKKSLSVKRWQTFSLNLRTRTTRATKLSSCALCATFPLTIFQLFVYCYAERATR